MKQPATLPDRLVDWVQETRCHAPLLENEADALLANLQQLQQHEDRIATLETAPLTLGVYGHSQPGKNHLLAALQGEPDGRINIVLGDKQLDYLTHINPGNTPAAMAVRFSHAMPPQAAHYPLLLTLFCESELAQQIIDRYHAGAALRCATSSAVAARLDELESRRQAQPSGGITGRQMADVLRGYHRLQRRRNQLDEGVCHRMAELAPWLAPDDRATLLALLWGEDSALTDDWLCLARALHHLGHARQVLAPKSLVTDSFLLPAEGFLLPAPAEAPQAETDVMVCPLLHGQPASHLSLAQRDLVRLCAEVTFTLSRETALPGVELLDIPVHLLTYYGDRLLPDTLLICNAVDERRNAQRTGKALARWAEHTRCPDHPALPGLVWAITPHDARFANGARPDDGAQRAIGQPGKRWGTLQALDNHNMRCLLEWLSDALTPARREQRIIGLRARLHAQTVALFRRFRDAEQATPQQAEHLVRALQTSAARHGDLLASLTPSREALQQCWLQHHQRHQPKPEGFALDIDLFAGENQTVAQNDVSYARSAHQLWVNHLSRLARQPEAAQRFGLGCAQLSALCEALIVTGYRLDISAMLERAMRSGEPGMEADISRAGTTLGDFVAWLGYGGTAPDQRPPSRVNQGMPVFAPPAQADISRRLTRLGEQPARGNAGYVYDWLVALYTRATENIGYRDPRDVDEGRRQALLALLDQRRSREKSPAAMASPCEET